MIPKKIHYIWLSNDPLPPMVRFCMDSWKRHCPDYEIIHWDMAKCQKIIDEVPFVREAVAASKWAFASDYIRLYAVYTEGGIYLDSDVFMYQNFDCFLNNEYFTNVEFTSHYKKNRSWRFLNEDGTKKNPNRIGIPGIALQAAIFGGVAKHPFLAKCMEYYEREKFVLPNGRLNIENISPYVYAHAAQQFGFVYKDKMQRLENGIAIYPGNVFLPSCNPSKTKPFAIHVTNGSWRPFSQRLIRFIKRIPVIISHWHVASTTMEERLKEYESKPALKLPE